MDKKTVLEKIKNQIIISSQAQSDEPFHNEIAMNAMIETVINMGKINALRLAGKRDIKNTKDKFKNKVVIIGITKPDKIPFNCKEIVYITPSVDDAKSIIDAGADIVAFDSLLEK